MSSPLNVSTTILSTLIGGDLQSQGEHIIGGTQTKHVVIQKTIYGVFHCY